MCKDWPFCIEVEEHAVAGWLPKCADLVRHVRPLTSHICIYGRQYNVCVKCIGSIFESYIGRICDQSYDRTETIKMKIMNIIDKWKKWPGRKNLFRF